MNAFHLEWEARMMAAYSDERARGLHDDQCEYGRRSGRMRVFLCHCHKRKREASGLVKPPTENLEFPPPSCPVCGEELDFDDGWRCDGCGLSWDSRGSGSSCSFYDDYGDAVVTAKGGPDAA